MSTEPNVLYINRSDSRCGACGRNADPYEAAHDMTVMIGDGCGATYAAVSSHYWDETLHDRIREMRPDLPFQDGPLGGVA